MCLGCMVILGRYICTSLYTCSMSSVQVSCQQHDKSSLHTTYYIPFQESGSSVPCTRAYNTKDWAGFRWNRIFRRAERRLTERIGTSERYTIYSCQPDLLGYCPWYYLCIKCYRFVKSVPQTMVGHRSGSTLLLDRQRARLSYQILINSYPHSALLSVPGFLDSSKGRFSRG